MLRLMKALALSRYPLISRLYKQVYLKTCSGHVLAIRRVKGDEKDQTIASTQ
jgi:hypothetical protein